MRSFLATFGLILAVLGGAPSLAQSETDISELVAQDLPPAIADAARREGQGEALEERSFTDNAMALALGAAVLEDWDIALIHAERAAAGGEPLGATLSGHILLHGLSNRGVQEDEAVRWLRRAGEQGEADALVILSRLAAANRGGLEPFQAREFLATAAEAGDARAAHEYGLYLRDEGDPGAANRAIDWLRLASESGRTEAYVDYAEAVGDWVHGPGDLTTARIWYERAAEAGDGIAAAAAATMFFEGEGGAADPARGAELMRMGAELGTPSAMGAYALILFQGAPGVPANPAEAVLWARQGAELGDGESQFLYAYALATGDGVTQDLQRAFYWVRRAGAPRASGLSEDPDRARLEAQLRQAIPAALVDQIEAEAAADSTPF